MIHEIRDATFTPASYESGSSLCPCLCVRSDESRDLGFTVVIDMRNSTWEKIKPILKVLRDNFPGHVYTAYILKPDKFWQKQRTSIGSSKCKFEVSAANGMVVVLC